MELSLPGLQNAAALGVTVFTLPLVLAPATLDDKLNISLVYRQSSVTHPEAQRLIELFFAKLELFSKERGRLLVNQP